MNNTHGMPTIQKMANWIVKEFATAKYWPDENRPFMDGHYLSR